MKICIFTALLMVMNLEYLWIMAADLPATAFLWPSYHRFSIAQVMILLNGNQRWAMIRMI